MTLTHAAMAERIASPSPPLLDGANRIRGATPISVKPVSRKETFLGEADW